MPEKEETKKKGGGLRKVLFAFLGAAAAGFALGLLRRKRSPEAPEEITWEEARVEA